MAPGNAFLEQDLDPLTDSEVREFFRDWYTLKSIDEAGFGRPEEIKRRVKNVLDRFRGKMPVPEVLQDITNVLVDTLCPYIEGQGDLAVQELQATARQGTLNVNLVLSRAFYRPGMDKWCHPHLINKIELGDKVAATIRKGTRVIRRDEEYFQKLMDREPWLYPSDFKITMPMPDLDVATGKDLDSIATRHGLVRFLDETDEEFRDRNLDYMRGY